MTRPFPRTVTPNLACAPFDIADIHTDVAWRLTSKGFRGSSRYGPLNTARAFRAGVPSLLGGLLSPLGAEGLHVYFLSPSGGRAPQRMPRNSTITPCLLSPAILFRPSICQYLTLLSYRSRRTTIF